MTFGPLGMDKFFFWPAMKFELCTPALATNVASEEILLDTAELESL